MASAVSSCAARAANTSRYKRCSQIMLNRRARRTQRKKRFGSANLIWRVLLHPLRSLRPSVQTAWRARRCGAPKLFLPITYAHSHRIRPIAGTGYLSWQRSARRLLVRFRALCSLREVHDGRPLDRTVKPFQWRDRRNHLRGYGRCGRTGN